MKRTQFQRPQYERKPRAPIVVIQEEDRRSVIRPVGDRLVSVPKGIKAKPGKRAPTVEEAKWMDSIVAHGCVACRIEFGYLLEPAEVHHILRGGQRMGHLFTIPLCTWHHREAPTARHPWRKRFESKYGTELDLLAKLKQELNVFDQAEYTA